MIFAKKNILLVLLSIPQFCHAGGGMTCADILTRAKPVEKKKVKSACVLESHTIGMGRGTTESIYLCGKVKYKLVTEEDYECKVTVLKK